VILHLCLVALFTIGVSFLPSAPPLELGLGPGGGQGDFISVGLAADTGGGEGMIRPPITARPESAPPPPRPPETVVEESEVPAEVFTQEEPEPDTRPPPEPRRRPPPTEPERSEERPGLIPREADPGHGPRGGSGGAGGGLGSGRGVLVGSGSGEGTVDSWYVRQVEQRIGQNWLQTSLGQLARRVDAVASFSVQRDGRITDIRLEKSSGVSSVDLAVQRAIQASTPLPPLPYELRNRTVVFRAVFEYPPR
jgi:TonB family protein